MRYTLKDFHPPKIVPEKTMNAHLYGLKLMPNSLHLKKLKNKISRCVDKLLNNIKLSRNIFMNTSMYSQKVLMTIC